MSERRSEGDPGFRRVAIVNRGEAAVRLLRAGRVDVIDADARTLSPRLINRYDVIELDPGKHAAAKLEAAHRLAAFLLSPEGQKAIGEFRVGGEQLFHPSAAAPR